MIVVLPGLFSYLFVFIFLLELSRRTELFLVYYRRFRIFLTKTRKLLVSLAHSFSRMFFDVI